MFTASSRRTAHADSPAMRDRKGFALAVAIVAIVVIGTLIAGAFFASHQEYRIGRNTLHQERAFAIAEGSLTQAIERWNLQWNTAQGGLVTTIDTVTPQGDRARVQITKGNSALYWVVAEGSSGPDHERSRRRISRALRLHFPEMKFLGALTTRGNTKIGGSSFINGNDAHPSGWACDPLKGNLPGIAIDDATKITYSGCTNTTCVAGDPPVQEDPDAAKDSTYFVYGDQTWDDLVASANKIITESNLQDLQPSLTASGACNTADMKNWGEPHVANGGPCVSYFPTIYRAGDLTLNAGRGQGILLVDGDLSVQGGFEFFGIVIVKGMLKTAGTGGHFNGAVMAANVDLDQNQVMGNAVINYSSCAIEQTLAKTSYPKPVPDRSWAELY